MAKKKDKGKKDKSAGRTEAVRSAVDQAFQATAGQAATAASATATARDRAQDLVDELAQAAGKVREAFDDLRPPTGDDVRDLSARLERLEKRVGELEKAPARRPATSRSSSSRAKSGTSTRAKSGSGSTRAKRSGGSSSGGSSS